MSQELLTVEAAAERLRLHPKTLLRAIREGRLRASKVGKAYRILRGDLEVFAGLPPRPDAVAGEARVTAVVDVPRGDKELAKRLMTLVAASLNARGVEGPAARADVIHDPQARTLKIIVQASPGDAGTLLKLIEVWLER